MQTKQTREKKLVKSKLKQPLKITTTTAAVTNNISNISQNPSSKCYKKFERKQKKKKTSRKKGVKKWRVSMQMFTRFQLIVWIHWLADAPPTRNKKMFIIVYLCCYIKYALAVLSLSRRTCICAAHVTFSYATIVRRTR